MLQGVNLDDLADIVRHAQAVSAEALLLWITNGGTAPDFEKAAQDFGRLA